MDIKMHADFKEQLKSKLQKTLPGIEAHQKMLPKFRSLDALIPNENAKESGVIILLYPEAATINLILIQRTDDGGKHAGQIAFPGGKKEWDDKDIIATALREANEEVGLNAEDVEVLGKLSNLYINVSDFLVTPVVAWCKEKPNLHKSDDEVALIIYQDLKVLFNSKSETKIQIPSTGTQLYWNAPVYQIANQLVIWGATAMILSELEIILITTEN